MAVTRENLREWAIDWTNNPDISFMALDLFLDAAEKVISSPGVKSESLGDYSVTMQDNPLEAMAMQYLRPYRRIGVPK